MIDNCLCFCSICSTAIPHIAKFMLDFPKAPKGNRYSTSIKIQRYLGIWFFYASLKTLPLFCWSFAILFDHPVILQLALIFLSSFIPWHEINCSNIKQNSKSINLASLCSEYEPCFQGVISLYFAYGPDICTWSLWWISEYNQACCNVPLDLCLLQFFLVAQTIHRALETQRAMNLLNKYSARISVFLEDKLAFFPLC